MLAALSVSLFVIALMYANLYIEPRRDETE